MRSVFLMLVASAGSSLFLPLGVVAQSAPTPSQIAAARDFRVYLDADWQRWLAEYPEFATNVGERRFNRQWSDDSSAAIEARRNYLRTLLSGAGTPATARLKETEQETDDDTKAVLEKRLDVLQRRQEFIGKVDKILTNISNQLKLLEDTFGLINDEIRARSPEQVLADIDDVVTQTNTMTEVLEELAPYEQMAARMGV